MSGAGDDRNRTQATLTDSAGGLAPVHQGQANVHEDRIWVLQLRGRYSVDSICSF